MFTSNILSVSGYYEPVIVLLPITSCIFSLLTAGEKLSGVQLSPSNQQEMKNNVEKVLQFVASKKIRMHQTSAKGQCFLLSVVAEYTHLYLGITTFRRTIRSVAEGSE